MNENTKNLLEEVGRQLDQNTFPVVKNGGFVLPRKSTASLNRLGKELNHESERQGRPPAEPWAGAVGQQGSSGGPRHTGGSRQAGETSSFVDANEGSVYRTSLSSVCEAYPGTRVWEQEDGFWLLSESHLLPGLGRKVALLICVSTVKRAVRSWAFWYSELAGASWIGPRHTNFPDGSICAYEPLDGTWVFGDSLVELLDLYSVWALRHLHLEVFWHWPGPQAVAQPYERILELGDDEQCGCGRSGKRYTDCCKEPDLKRYRIAEAINFGFFTAWALRFPPKALLEFMKLRGQPPLVAELI